MNFDEARCLGAELELVSRNHLDSLFKQKGNTVNSLRNLVEGGVSTLWLELAPSESSPDDAVSR